MKELEEIAAAYRVRSGQCALATVVRVEGSSYRQPGARMLVDAGGRALAGCVSGGCLEADVAAHAQLVIAAGEPRVLVYDTVGDSDGPGEPLLGVGTGCEGIVEILVEPLAGEQPAAIYQPLAASGSNQAVAVATVYRRGGQAVAEHIASGDVGMKTQAAGLDVFFEHIQPAPRLLLCGGGSDAAPITRLAREILGWRVVVADHRAAYADGSRFAAGTEVVLARPETLAGLAAIDRRTAVVVMTHNYRLDRELLAVAARSEAFYVGVLGSRKRWRTMAEDLLSEGIDVDTLLGDRLHAPVGLDIGATLPETIALSVAAEVQAALSERPGGRLGDRTTPVWRNRQEGTANRAAYTATAEPAPLRASAEPIKGVKPRCLISLPLPPSLLSD